MSAFALNVLASVVAAVVMVLLTALISTRARWILTGLLGRLLDVDIDAVFPDKHEASTDVRRELARAHDVAIVTGRGNELQRDTFDPIFMHRPAAKPLRVRVLLPRTDTGMDYDWTQQRHDELCQFDQAFRRPGLLKEQIETTARFLEQYVSAGAAELRRFNAPHMGRLIITERCVYFTPYRSNSHGRDSVVLKFRRGEMYDNFLRLFEQLWNAGLVAREGVNEEAAAELQSPQ